MIDPDESDAVLAAAPEHGPGAAAAGVNMMQIPGLPAGNYTPSSRVRILFR